jgi:ribosome-associated protein
MFPPIEVPILEELLTELAFKTSRSGGSGGQHVNKVSSKVELDFDVAQSSYLSSAQKAYILEKLGSRLTKDGVLQIIAQSERSQLQNKKLAIEKFKFLISTCFRVTKDRIPSAIPKKEKEKRRLQKKIKAQIKKMRKRDY